MADPAAAEAMGMDERAAVESFLFHEAAMLDGREFDEWLGLFDEDAIYWIPGGSDEIDPSREVSIVYDRLPRLRERVWRLGSGMAWAQEPPSRTLHVVGNVMVSPVDADLRVNSTLVVTEFRRERQLTHAGRCRHDLRRTPHGLRIALKKIELVNNNGNLGNLSILL